MKSHKNERLTLEPSLKKRLIEETLEALGMRLPETINLILP